jgi:hypothetical protein
MRHNGGSRIPQLHAGLHRRVPACPNVVRASASARPRLGPGAQLPRGRCTLRWRSSSARTASPRSASCARTRATCRCRPWRVTKQGLLAAVRGSSLTSVHFNDAAGGSAGETTRGASSTRGTRPDRCVARHRCIAVRMCKQQRRAFCVLFLTQQEHRGSYGRPRTRQRGTFPPPRSAHAVVSPSGRCLERQAPPPARLRTPPA